MMTPRLLRVVRFLICAGAIGGCQLVSGASSLEITGDGGAAAQEAGGSDAPGVTEASADARGDAPANADAADGADTAFVACTKPTGGAFTQCRAGGIPGVTTCIEYCATKSKCCAEDCKPFSTDQSVKDAQLNADTESTCIDPLSGPPTNGYTACSNSPLPGADKWFKCCCR